MAVLKIRFLMVLALCSRQTELLKVANSRMVSWMAWEEFYSRMEIFMMERLPREISKDMDSFTRESLINGYLENSKMAKIFLPKIKEVVFHYKKYQFGNAR